MTDSKFNTVRNYQNDKNKMTDAKIDIKPKQYMLQILYSAISNCLKSRGVLNDELNLEIYKSLMDSTIKSFSMEKLINQLNEHLKEIHFDVFTKKIFLF